jgi:uncharacterized membrane protein YedE/YeeE
MASSLLGGALIGLSASLAHALGRQVTGVSGQVGALLGRSFRPWGFALWFTLGLALGGLLISTFATPAASSLPPRSLGVLGVAGVLVGFGTRLGSGCTSGHGVCGISRLSTRSFVATGVFMFVAALVVLLSRHVFAAGGAP